MYKLLFISNDLGRNESGGKTISQRNLAIISTFQNFNIDVVSFGNIENFANQINIDINYNKMDIFIKNIFMYAGNLNKKSEKKILDIYLEKNYDFVFFDCSLFGRIAKKIKIINSKVKVISFFHNVEALYYKERMRIDGIRYFPLMFSAYYNEMLSSKYSDKLIAISTRDREILEKKYSVKIDIELPVSFADNFVIEKVEKTNEKMIKLLFVGSNFFANVEGISWFVRNVMPSINGELHIVGNGMEVLKAKLTSEKVKVIGGVKSLSDYYYEADLVIAPIFSGSGMKVKTAEALMYGKTIFGTQEAFAGYDLEYEKIGGICNSKEDFVEKINFFINNTKYESKFNPFSREYYLEKYSNEIIKKQLEKIFLELSHE